MAIGTATIARRAAPSCRRSGRSRRRRPGRSAAPAETGAAHRRSPRPSARTPHPSRRRRGSPGSRPRRRTRTAVRRPTPFGGARTAAKPLTCHWCRCRRWPSRAGRGRARTSTWWSSHCATVSLSHLSAFLAFHGASSGIVLHIWASSSIAVPRFDGRPRVERHVARCPCSGTACRRRPSSTRHRRTACSSARRTRSSVLDAVLSRPDPCAAAVDPRPVGATSVKVRPPTRSRASSSATDCPACFNRNAAVRPAKPAPTTQTSTSAMTGWSTGGRLRGAFWQISTRSSKSQPTSRAMDRNGIGNHVGRCRAS